MKEKGEWQGMRLTGQLRRDEGVKTPQNVNSIYKVRFAVVLPLRFN
jgi:ribosome biogenesis protein BMS1